MKKDAEWLKIRVELAKTHTRLDGGYRESQVIFYDKLIELINQLDTPKVPTIPLYASKVIEIMKEAEANDEFPISLEKDNGKVTDREVKKAQEWALNNYTEYTKAYANGYKIEEQKYKVLDKDDIQILGRVTFISRELLSKTDVSEGDVISVGKFSLGMGWESELTEQEIKDFDKRYMDFAIPVDDLDE